MSTATIDRLLCAARAAAYSDVLIAMVERPGAKPENVMRSELFLSIERKRDAEHAAIALMEAQEVGPKNEQDQEWR